MRSKTTTQLGLGWVFAGFSINGFRCVYTQKPLFFGEVSTRVSEP